MSPIKYYLDHKEGRPCHGSPIQFMTSRVHLSMRLILVSVVYLLLEQHVKMTPNAAQIEISLFHAAFAESALHLISINEISRLHTIHFGRLE